MPSALFEPLSLRGLTLAHRAWASPMCQYSAVDGVPGAWHLVHLGGLATGGAALVLSEATAVVPEGRISPGDTGLWDDDLAGAWEPIVAFVRAQGAAFGIQLAHAGRKASSWAPWKGHGSVPAPDGGWTTVAPSAQAFGHYAAPTAMTTGDLVRTREAFAAAAARAGALGADVVEIHAAHGYLLHQFLSPLSNQRDDAYGGSLEARLRYPLEVIEAVRGAWPEDRPLLLRVSATDWVEGGWDAESTVVLAAAARDRGVDLVDVSSGGLDPRQQIPLGPGYQVPLAARVRREAGVPVSAVGLITSAAQAEAVVAGGEADAVMLARALLREPRWPLLAAHELGADLAWPPQYERGRPA